MYFIAPTTTTHIPPAQTLLLLSLFSCLLFHFGHPKKKDPASLDSIHLFVNIHKIKVKIFFLNHLKNIFLNIFDPSNNDSVIVVAFISYHPDLSLINTYKIKKNKKNITQSRQQRANATKPVTNSTFMYAHGPNGATFRHPRPWLSTFTQTQSNFLLKTEHDFV